MEELTLFLGRVLTQAVPLVTVTVWEISRRGRLQEIALTPDAFKRPRRGRYSITSHSELVGDVPGEISTGLPAGDGLST